MPRRSALPTASLCRERAIRTLRDAAFEALLAAGESQRTTDLARAVAERCGLATDESSLSAVAPLVRMVLVPSTMELLRDANWWFPKWMQRWVPKIGVEREPESLEDELARLTERQRVTD